MDNSQVDLKEKQIKPVGIRLEPLAASIELQPVGNTETAIAEKANNLNNSNAAVAAAAEPEQPPPT